MDRKKVQSIVKELAARTAGELGMELVGVDFKTSRGGVHIIVFIDKPAGVSLDDCEQVSKSLGELLDLHDPVPPVIYGSVLLGSKDLCRRGKTSSDFRVKRPGLKRSTRFTVPRIYRTPWERFGKQSYFKDRTRGC